MSKLKDTLEEKGIALNNLSPTLKKSAKFISDFENSIERARAEQIENPSDEGQEIIADNDDALAGYLADFASDLDEYIARRQEKAAQTQAPKANSTPEERKVQDPEPKPNTPPKDDDESEEGGGFGTLILAGIVLAVTLGAVNILKNK
jgi:hypothetical protein